MRDPAFDSQPSTFDFRRSGHPLSTFHFKSPLLFLSLLLLLISPSVFAQTPPPQSTTFQLQRFRPLGDNLGMFQTQSAQSMGQWKYMVGMFLNYGHLPFSIAPPFKNEAPLPVMEHQLGADVFAGIGLTKFLDLVISFPITLYQVGQIPANPFFPNADHSRNLSGFSISDLKLQIKVKAIDYKNHYVGFQFLMSFPTGNKETMNGENGFSFGVALLAQKRVKIVNIALNVGYRYLPPTSLDKYVLQHEFFYSLGVGVQLGKYFEAIVDFTGNTFLGENIDAVVSPFEAFAGGRIMPLGRRALSINIGVAAGLNPPGISAPRFRGILGIVWSPRDRDTDGDGIFDSVDRCPTVKGPRSNQGCPWPDTDGDGITDNLDKCPKTPGPKENKGCPWPDTDGDGITDNLDKCPQTKGPIANKGCPWGDTDGDGIPDNQDQCPKVKGPKANKGCPWGDTDGDGIKDNVDKCPKVKGPKINKGCPDIDSDKDDIEDRLDKCPFVKGKPNAKNPEKHGCPRRILVRVTKTEIFILQKIQFRTGSARILRRSYPILNQVVAVMQSKSTIRIRVEGHTDNRGGKSYNLKLSQRRATSVVRYLTRKGIPKDRLTAKGFGLVKPLVPNNSRKNRAKNRRVQFKVMK